MTNIRGNKIILRALEPKDLDDLYTWENNPENWLISSTSAPFSKHVLEQYIESSHQDIYQTRQLRLIIEDIENSVSVGAIDIFDFDPLNQRAGLGILIAEPENRGKGYASESLSLILEYCFQTLGLKQVYCNILTSNTESIKLFENKGFKFIGTKKEWIRSGRDWLDENMYQLVNL